MSPVVKAQTLLLNGVFPFTKIGDRTSVDKLTTKTESQLLFFCAKRRRRTEKLGPGNVAMTCFGSVRQHVQRGITNEPLPASRLFILSTVPNKPNNPKETHCA